MADRRINEIPLATGGTAPVPSDNVPIDGATTRRTTIQALVDTGVPVASQAEAEAGENNSKRMTPLTTAQAISSLAITGDDIGSSVQGYSDSLQTLSAVIPGAAGTSILAMTLAADVRDFIDTAPYVDTIADLKNINPTKDKTVLVSEHGRGGIFNWLPGDQTVAVAGDPQGGISVASNVLSLSNGCWSRFYEGAVLATWFGLSVSNAASANDIALQAAINLVSAQSNAQRRTLRVPAGDYSTSATMTYPKNALQFSLVGDGMMATVIRRSDSSATPIFRAKNEGGSMFDLSIQQSTFVGGDGSRGILIKKDYGTIDPDTGVMPTADADFLLSRVRITGFDIAAEFWGRGFTIGNCSLSTNGWAASVNWPNLSDYTEGSQSVQKDLTGFRGFRFNNITAHSNLYGAFINEGPNAAKINGVQVGNIRMDIGRRLWQGVLRQAVISGWEITQTPTPGFTLTDGSEDYIITGGTIQGDTNAARVPNYFIELTGNQSSGYIEFLGRNCTSHGVYHDGSGIATDMVLDLTLVEPCTSGGGSNAVRFNGANHTGDIRVTLDTASPIAGVVRGTSSSNAMRVSKVQCLRSHTPPLDPASLGIRMDNDVFVSAPTAGNFANFKNHDNTVRGTIKADGASSIAYWFNETLDTSIRVGSGSPESVLTAGRGTLYVDLGAGANLYIKSTTTGNTGWKLITRAA